MLRILVFYVHKRQKGNLRLSHNFCPKSCGMYYNFCLAKVVIGKTIARNDTLVYNILKYTMKNAREASLVLGTSKRQKYKTTEGFMAAVIPKTKII